MAQQPEANAPSNDLPPVKIAFIIDGEVVDVLHTDPRLGAIFLSEPLIIDVSDLRDNDQFPNIVGKLYNAETKKFIEKSQS